MATYYGVTRSNYFHVTDAEKLKSIINAAVTDEGSLELWAREINGEKLYAFGAYGSIVGIPPSFFDENEEDWAEYDLFTAALQSIIVPDDAIIITEIGYEKLRYLNAFATIITKNDVKCEVLGDCTIRTARDMLNKPDWTTRMDY